MTGEQLALDVQAGDVHACNFMVRGDRLRCRHCGAEKALPTWSITQAPEHDWIEVSVTARASGPLILYQCRHCGLGATQIRPAAVQPNPAPTCRARASARDTRGPGATEHEVRPHFTDERGT